MGESIWKKEVSFKRKPKAAAEPETAGLPAEPAAPEQAEKQSFLKKEISFSRKQKQPKDEQAEKQSFLKKEISFSRKQKESTEPDAPKQSIWKKDISLARGSKADREVGRLAEEAARAIAPAPPAIDPVQPTELAEAVVAAMPDPVPPAPAPALEPYAPAPEPVLEPYPPAPAPALEPVALVPDVQPVVELPVDPAPLSSLSPAILAASNDPVEPAALAEPVAPVTPLEPGAPLEPVAPAVVWPEPEPAVEAPAAEPWLAAPALPPDPEVAAPVTVHPPVPAAELPPLEEPPAKVPFWKKDVSLSRKPKAEKPARVKAAGSAPFWKRELSFSRKPKQPAEAVTEQLPAVKSAPFWKREVSLSKPKLPSRKPAASGAAKGGRAKRVVGLKIGASQLAAARVSNNGVAELQQVARQALASGVVVGGELRDPEALGDALKTFFARNKLPKKGVRLGIASNRIGVRIIDIVGVAEEKQLANAVHFRAQEALPIPLDEAVLDYRVLDESVNTEGQPVKRVLLVVVYRELVDRYVSACRKAGITLAGIDLEAFALLRALGAPEERNGSALVAVAIGHDRSTFAVSDGRICEFTRVVEWGGSALNIALARAFDSTPSAVEPIKCSLSLDGSVTPQELSAEQAAVALEAVRRQVQWFARELVSSLQFYQNQPGSLGIGEIVITGGTAQMPGLAAELERLIGVHVRIGDPFARLKLAKKVANAEHVGSLAVAIGLGIED